MELTRLRGFVDWLGAGSRAMLQAEAAARALMPRYGVGEIRVPVLERIQLYQRSTGETSDVVEKQMYTFSDRDEAETVVALRPEGTPGVVRAYIEAGLDRSDPEQRFFYSGPMFRRERPQKGRYRQFYQFGVEVFGRADAACDAELLIMIDDYCKSLRLSARMELNSIGDATCRPAFREALVKWGREHWDELCEDCHNRIDRNPLRLLDCKIDAKLAQSAPSSIDYLCSACRTHFDTVRGTLDASSVKYEVNARLVRGLDYYTRTAFEIMAEGLGAQSTIVAGGRYDGLVEAMGGAAVPGIGFAIGLERVALALEAAELVDGASIDAVVIAMGDDAIRQAAKIAQELRAAGLTVEMASALRKLKASLSRANKIGARFAVIIGENEMARGVVQLRDLAQSTQREVAVGELPAALASAGRN